MGIGDRIVQARKSRRLSQDALARAVNQAQTTISSWERGRTEPGRADVEKVARALGVTVAELEGTGGSPGLVQIIGRVGADASGSVVMTTAHESWDMAPPPPGGTSDCVALDVRGDSMHTFAENGALIYFEDQRAPLDPELIGVPCVVETEDGRVLVKRPKRGSQPGLYDLESDFGPVMRDVRLTWAAEIIAVIPPRQARRIIVKASDAA